VLSLLTTGDRMPRLSLPVGGRIDFAKVHDPTRAALITELDGEERCEEFFAGWRSCTADKGYETLEYEVTASYARTARQKASLYSRM